MTTEQHGGARLCLNLTKPCEGLRRFLLHAANALCAGQESAAQGSACSLKHSRHRISKKIADWLEIKYPDVYTMIGIRFQHFRHFPFT